LERETVQREPDNNKNGKNAKKTLLKKTQEINSSGRLLAGLLEVTPRVT